MKPTRKLKSNLAITKRGEEMNLSEQMKIARVGIRRDKARWNEMIGNHEAEHQRNEDLKKDMMSNLREASISDYLDGLSEYSQVTKSVFTHRYDYTFYNADFYVALNDFTISPLHGSQSINIIVPKHVTVYGELGHNNLYLHGDEPEHIGGWVPYYTDLDGVSEHNEI